MLDSFRRSFTSAYEGVVRAIRDELGLAPTGRPAKSTASIVEKLRRESLRLTQMQDVAGCRVVVADPAAQERVVDGLVQRFPRHSVIDRRSRPSHGYRAVHVVVNDEGKQVEIQVRTVLQHQWAELSEKWSDVRDPSIKYGGGDREARSFLDWLATMVAAIERREQQLQGETPPLPSNLPEVERIAASFETQEEVEVAKSDLALHLWMKRVTHERGS